MTKPSVEARTVEEIAARLRDIAFREEPSADSTDDDWAALQHESPITLDEMSEMCALMREAADALQSAEARALREAAEDSIDEFVGAFNADRFRTWLRARATEKESPR